MSYENIIVEREDNIATLTVNRPKVLNALNDATVAELDRAVDELAADEGVKAVVITGAGERAFVAGADINELKALRDAIDAMGKMTRGHQLLRKIETLPKPVIIAINGYALGGGCEIAMAGDIRIAADTARLGLPEINLGLFPGYGGTQRLPRLVGKSMAKLMIFSGEHLDAQEALRVGLVDRVVPAAELMASAKELAKKLAGKAPIALRLAKQCIDLGIEMDLDRGLAYEVSQSGITQATEDRVEGTSAFLEKRQPQFKGR
ncbi:MAG: enoyl-CoA hydratase/isomerase family protein [Chloroflexi bacterium]|nr:enoyl-CoA hydratase/isomerase family protein [Chloroflexota bacterium]